MDLEDAARNGAARYIGIGLRPATVARALGIIIVMLWLAHIATLVSRFVLGYPTALGLADLFDLNSERNIPTFFSALMLVGAATIFGVIANGQRQGGGRHAFLWAALGAVLLFMAVDEAAAIHEWIGGKLQPLLGTSGLLYYAWVIPYAGLAATVAAMGLRLALALPGRIRAGFILAGLLYVGGALGMEMIGARYASRHGIEDVSYALIITVEETLELAGLLVLVYTSLMFLTRAFAGVEIGFARSGDRTVGAPGPPGRRRTAGAATGGR